jgi:amino acid permease
VNVLLFFCDHRNRFLQTIGVVIFAFSCHTGLNPISAEMKDTSMKNMSRAIHSSVTLCITCFLLVAVGGYLTFYGVGFVPCCSLCVTFGDL